MNNNRIKAQKIKNNIREFEKIDKKIKVVSLNSSTDLKNNSNSQKIQLIKNETNKQIPNTFSRSRNIEVYKAPNKIAVLTNAATMNLSPILSSRK